jgi:hypothetical protein
LLNRLLSRSTALALLGLGVLASPAAADKIKNPMAVFSGLDKITGRTISFEVAVNETVQFGSLQLTPRVCYSRPAYDKPRTDAFVEVDEITVANEYKRIFTGWMFADSPGLNAIEHPVYDIWLTACKGGTEVIKSAPDEDENKTAPSEPRVPPPVSQAPTRKPPPVEAHRPPPAQRPTQRYFPTNEPPPPSAEPIQRPPARIPQFDPTIRDSNR